MRNEKKRDENEYMYILIQKGLTVQHVDQRYKKKEDRKT